MEIIEFSAPIGNLTGNDLAVAWNASAVPMRIRSLDFREAPRAAVSRTTNRGDDDVRVIDFLAFEGRLWEPYEKRGQQFNIGDIAPGESRSFSGAAGMKAFLAHPFRMTASNEIVEASRRGVRPGMEIALVPQIVVGGRLWTPSKGPVVTSIRFDYVPRDEIWLTQQPPSWRSTVPMPDRHKFWSAFETDVVHAIHAKHHRTAPEPGAEILLTDGWDKETCIRAMQDESMDLIAREMLWSLRRKNHIDAPREAMKAWVEIERILGARWPEGNHLKSTMAQAMTIPDPSSVPPCTDLLPAIKSFAEHAEGQIGEEVLQSWRIAISIVEHRLAAEAELSEIWAGI